MHNAPITHLLYLHGFRSSPASAKAQLLANHVAANHPDLHWWCPQLPPSPREAMDLVMRGIAGWPRERMAVAGSSLGGFYATYVAAMTNCPVVLLNPAVQPARDLARHIGTQTHWHDPQQSFDFRPEHVQELRTLEVGPLPRPERCFAIIAKGDEVLDWRAMSARYPGSRIKLVEGSDHALSDFAQAHLADVIAFLQPA